MLNNNLFDDFQLGSIHLKNRAVMAPMTRCRAIGNIANELIAEYYAQRAGAGLIITEGTSPSPNGLGYARIPGIFSTEQIKGWKIVTDAVHKEGSKIFVQMMHTGRVGSKINLPAGAKLLAPSAVTCSGQMWTDTQGMQEMDEPQAMSAEEIQTAIKEFALAASNAIEAGFDGVELHAANGYLLEQFISPVSNVRTDAYGGSIENRCRFVIETAIAVIKAIGAEKTGIRLSPYGVNSSMAPYPEIDDTYNYLAEQLNALQLTYIHLVDHSAMGAPVVPDSIKQSIRQKFNQTLILSGGFDLNRANHDLEAGKADLIAFGRPFMNNPDLVNRMQSGFALNEKLDQSTFYAAGPEGYTDYQVYK